MNIQNPVWMETLRQVSPKLGVQENKIADFAVKNPDEFMQLTITEIADLTSTSKSTVVRFCNKLGYSGLKDFKCNFNLVEQEPLPDIFDSKIEWGDTYETIREKIFTGCVESLVNSKKVLSDVELHKAVDLLLEANTIYLYAYGGSQPNLFYFLHKLMKLGLKSQSFTDKQKDMLSFSHIKKGDVIFLISSEGRSKTVVETAIWAKERAIPTISMTNHIDSPLAKNSSVILQSAGGSFQDGDYNTYSRVAQLATIDLLFATLITRIGEEKFHQITEIHYKHKKRRNP
ncbi:MAG: MurR/RpiR family transcriptional regulator [Sphaerochaetaceae bacterium]|jgi:DNA-binding MurR/RpiR family transcriptional regulator